MKGQHSISMSKENNCKKAITYKFMMFIC